MSKNIGKAGDANQAEELDALLSRMQGMTTDTGLQTQSFQALHDRLQGTAVNLSSSETKKIIKLAVHAIRSHDVAKQTTLCVLVCEIISKLCISNPWGRQCVLQDGGLEAILAVMQQNPSAEERLQQAACEMIYSAVASHLALPSTTLEAITQVTLNAAKLYQANHPLLMSGIGIIMLLGHRMERAAAENAIRLVVQLMRASPWAKDIYSQSVACTVLWTLVETGEAKDKPTRTKNIKMLWKHGALQMVLSAFHIILSHGSADEDAAQREVGFEKGCMLIEKMYEVPNEAPNKVDLSVIPCLMNKFIQNAGVQHAGMGALTSPMLAKKSSVVLDGKEAAKTVMSIVASHTNNNQLECEAFNVLANLAYFSRESQDYITSQTSLKFFVCHMQKFVKIGDMQRHVMGLFKRLAAHGDASVGEAFVNAGCVQAIVGAVQAHVYLDHQVLHVACEALAMTLRVVDSDSCRTIMVKQGAADAVLDALGAGRLCEKLAEFGVVALLGLIHEHEDNSKAVGSRSIPILTSVMLRHGDNVGIQTGACACLDSILTCVNATRDFAAFQKIVAEYGGLTALARCLGMLEMGAKRNGERLHMIREVLRCVQKVAKSNAKNQVRCVEEGVVGEILRLMDAYATERELQVDACLCLCEICCGNVRVEDSVAKHGGYERARRAFDMLPEDGIKNMLLQLLSAAMPGFVDSERAHNQRELGATKLQQPVVEPHDMYRSRAYKSQTQTQTQTMCPYSEGAKSKNRLLESCVVCGKTAQELGMDKMFKCSACSIRPLYCSPECQRAHWGEHRPECKANKKVSKK
jgi:hypothetical protein